jgi:hypothetical protein
MRAFDVLRSTFDRLAVRLTAGRGNAFACGECERWERCGLAPSEQCIARAAQLAHRNEQAQRRTAPAHWWGNLGAG